MARPAERRLALAAAALLLGLALVGARLYWLQVAQRERVLATSYLDNQTLELLDRLLASGALRPGPQGRVLLDRAALRRLVPQEALRQRVEQCAHQARLYPGDKGFDYRLVRVLAPGLRAGLRPVVRGAILDRQGRPLAVSRLDAASGVQRRYYPLGDSASQVLGFHHPVFGSHGLEAALEPLLARAAAQGPAPANPAGLEPARAGTPVRLSLDADLQRVAQAALDQRPGALVMLEVASGAVLAAAGWPSFDPNSGDFEAWRSARLKRQGRLLRAKPWAELYPPGSVFKLLVAAAWLEQNPDQAEPVIICHGRDRALGISDLKAHGRVDLNEALVKSCNVFFARLGVGLGPRVARLARELGFNQAVDLLPQLEGFSLPAEPSLAYAAWRYDPAGGPGRSARRRSLVPFTTFRRDRKIAAQCAIGQNLVAVTVLQMASLAQAIANGGLLRRPYLAAGLAGSELGPAPARRVFSPATARRLARAMEQVMSRGTGRSAGKIFLAGAEITVAGKTGTAETGREGEKPHAWFVGYAPARQPRVALALVLENAGLSSRSAAPLGVRLLGAALGAPLTLEARITGQGDAL